MRGVHHRVIRRHAVPDIAYYKTRTGHEVDFVARMPDGTLKLVQVCESLADPTTRTRETRALARAMADLDLSSSAVVTREAPPDADQSIEVDGRTIDVVPAWRFLLELG